MYYDSDMTRTLEQRIANNFRPPSIEDMMLRQAQVDLANTTYAQATSDQLRTAARRREHDSNRITKFRETYVKLRSENIVLDHQSAIELAKMIHSEAELITLSDLP